MTDTPTSKKKPTRKTGSLPNASRAAGQKTVNNAGAAGRRVVTRPPPPRGGR